MMDSPCGGVEDGRGSDDYETTMQRKQPPKVSMDYTAESLLPWFTPAISLYL